MNRVVLVFAMSSMMCLLLLRLLLLSGKVLLLKILGAILPLRTLSVFVVLCCAVDL